MVGLQAVVVVVLSLVLALTMGNLAAKSALLGGVCNVLPSSLFALWLFWRVDGRNPKQVLMRLYSGEVFKLFFSGLLLVIVLKSVHIRFLPLLAGFAIGQLGFWLAPMLAKPKSEKTNKNKEIA